MKKLENLVGRKVKCTTSRWNDLTLNKVYEINKETNFNFYINNDDLLQNSFSKNNLETHFELLPNEPQFNQGDKVLVSNNKSHWVDGEFITEYKDEFVVKTHHSIIGRKYIKPYEEEIKVGDWVHNRNGHIMKCDDVDIFNRNNWIKITDELLINKLNELWKN